MDVVITYVQPTEQFIETYNQYTKDIEGANRADGHRFRTYGVLDLQIKLIRKYMPYINNIFVVVSSEDQIPDEFDMSLCKFIYHNQIIPEEFLPLFNSCSIEMFIHRIPDLSEEFVYFNDDMFVINDLPKEVFFKDGKPCLDFEIHDLPTYKWDHTCKMHAFNSLQINAKQFGVEGDYEDKLIEFAHVGRPLLKSSCDDVYKLYHDQIIASLSILRQQNNMNTNLFNCYEIVRGNYIEAHYNSVYYMNDNIDIVLDCLNKKRVQLMCVNDTVWSLFDTFKEHFRKGLEANLNDTIYIRDKSRSDKIIVSYMSDANNLQLAYILMRTMVEYETYVPDKVILNLSKTNVKEEDLPEDLTNYIKEHSDICEIYWCDTYTEFNRLFPTIERYPDDIIIPIHLNYKYTADFIETLYKDYLAKGKSCPLSYYKPKDNEPMVLHGIFNITEAKYYKKYLKEILDDFNYSRSFSYENLIYTMVAKLNGYYYERGSKNFDNLINSDIHEDFLYSEVNETILDRFNEYIKQKYESIQ